MMQPITAQTRSVPSMSSLRRDDLSWSMGTNQAPMAGVAVLSRFSCLQTQHRDLFSTLKVNYFRLKHISFFVSDNFVWTTDACTESSRQLSPSFSHNGLE